MRSLTFTPTEKVAATWRKILSCLVLLMVCTLVSAQKTINGVVKDAANGSPVTKATVQVKGTSRGTTTNDKGEFSIQAATNESLVISAIGFAPVEQPVGSSTELNISLSTATKEMEAVVVTALGISRQQKALGYSAQQVKAEDLN